VRTRATITALNSDDATLDNNNNIGERGNLTRNLERKYPCHCATIRRDATRKEILDEEDKKIARGANLNFHLISVSNKTNGEQMLFSSSKVASGYRRVATTAKKEELSSPHVRQVKRIGFI